MQGIDDKLIQVFERIWKQQGREGTFAEFIEHQAHVSEEERVKRIVAQENAKPGNLNEKDGYNCPKCLNRGEIWWAWEHNGRWTEQFRRCECWRVRAAIKRMKASGLENSLHKLSEFEVTEEWQKGMLDRARAYIAQDKSNGESFFIGGAVGCGKTFICSAICRDLLGKGHEVVYMPWITEAARLKALASDDTAADEIAAYSHAEYLYIDDFFKPTGTNSEPTSADIRLAYDIINYRYINKMPTIVSSEKYIRELMDIDEATASRLYERAKGFTTNVKRDPARNYRTHGADDLL